MRSSRLTVAARVSTMTLVVLASASCGSDTTESSATGSSSVATEATPAPSDTESSTLPPEVTSPVPSNDPVTSDDAGSTTDPVTSTDPVNSSAPGSPTEIAVADLSARLGVEPGSIEVVSVDEVTWPDGSLGCPEPGMVYTQALVDGSLIVLRADGIRHEYHSGGSRDPFYCPPAQVQAPTGARDPDT